MPQDCCDNRQASLYKARVTNKKNLEASNQLFIKLDRGGAPPVACVSFWMACSITVDPLTNGLDREKIYDDAEDFEPGAFVTKDSPYHSYFHFQNDNAFPDNVTNEGWWGHDTLPKLNYEESPELEAYILNVAKKMGISAIQCRRLASGCGS